MTAQTERDFLRKIISGREMTDQQFLKDHFNIGTIPTDPIEQLFQGAARILRESYGLPADRDSVAAYCASGHGTVQEAMAAGITAQNLADEIAENEYGR